MRRDPSCESTVCTMIPRDRLVSTTLPLRTHTIRVLMSITEARHSPVYTKGSILRVHGVHDDSQGSVGLHDSATADPHHPCVNVDHRGPALKWKFVTFKNHLLLLRDDLKQWQLKGTICNQIKYVDCREKRKCCSYWALI